MRTVGRQSCCTNDRRENSNLATNASLDIQGSRQSNWYLPTPRSEILNRRSSHRAHSVYGVNGFSKDRLSPYPQNSIA